MRSGILQEMNKQILNDYLLFNRDIIIGIIFGLATSANSTFANSLISLVADISVFLTIFGILYYRDNKHDFIVKRKFTGQNYDKKEKRIEFAKLKWVLIKLASTLSVAEIEYNNVKPYFHYLFLSKGYEPFIASIIASFDNYSGLYCHCKYYGLFYPFVQTTTEIR
jgi:purine-cytosine permease-like protein